jgi:hypothetical protein
MPERATQGSHTHAEREVSRGRSSRRRAAAVPEAKGRMERRAKRFCVLEWQCVRSPCKWSYRWRVGVKLREQSGVAKPCRRAGQRVLRNRRSDGTGHRARQPRQSVEARAEEQGKRRHRRDARGGVAGVPEGKLGEDPDRLLAGRYRPSAVRRHEIPKSGGGVRQLGIPIVLDRFIQQAILQVLQPIFDPSFSERSYPPVPPRSSTAACPAGRWCSRA